MPHEAGLSRGLKAAVAVTLFLVGGALLWSNARTGSDAVASVNTASSAISPFDLIRKASQSLPVEKWDAF